jgi:hypothetical protein
VSEHPGQNSLDKTVLARWTGEILSIHRKLEDQKMENLRLCKIIRQPLPDLYDAAKNAGLPPKAFKAFIKAELAERAYKKRLENVTPEDDDDADAYELMRSIAQEGDLFDHAAKEHAKGKPEKDAPGESGEVVDIRPRYLKENEAARIAKENSDKLTKGIVGLPGADANEA